MASPPRANGHEMAESTAPFTRGTRPRTTQRCKNDATASAFAPVPRSCDMAASSRAAAAAICSRCGAFNSPLTVLSISAGLSAICCACCCATVNNSSGAQTFQTSPISRASSAEIHSDDKSAQAAFWRPNSRGSRYVEAASGERR